MANLAIKLAKEVFDSGKAIGFKTNITGATGWLKNHPKGVGEQIGNILTGKAKNVNDMLIKSDMYDKVFTHLDDVAKQYPNATVQVAAKNAKKGGYQIAKVTIKNGNETIYNQALSISNNGTFKTKFNGMGTEVSEFANPQGLSMIATSKTGTAKATYNTLQKTGQLELSHAGEQVAVANYVNKGGNATRGGLTYETADDMISGQMYYNNHEISFLGNTKGLRDLRNRYMAEAAEQRKKIEPLVLQLLRPLRDRFNTAIDLFKYNDKKDFERFVSKQELRKSVKELDVEISKLEGLKKAKTISTDETAYLAQIKSDRDCARELIQICV